MTGITDHGAHQQQSEQAREKREEDTLRAQRWIAGTGIALALISLVSNIAMYCVSNKSAEAAKASAEAAAEANRINKSTYRAHLHFGVAPLVRPALTAEGLFSWKVKYFNDGGGTATHIWHDVRIGWNSQPPPALVYPGGVQDYKKQLESFPVFPPLSRGGKDYMGLQPFISESTIPVLRQHVLTEQQMLTIQVLLYYTDDNGDAHACSRCIIYPNANSSQPCLKGDWED